MPVGVGGRVRVVVVVLGIAAQAVLAHRTALPGGILDRRYALLLEVALWAGASALTVVALLRLPRRVAVGLLLGGALVVRLAALSDKAPLSDDLYRYAWDGVVQDSGTDPYRSPPLSPALAPLRDVPGMAWIWPPERRATASPTRINRPAVRTIYPPVAEAWFWAVHRVVPLSARDRGYEGAGLVLDLAVLAVLLALLRSGGGDPRWAAVYGLAPLPVLEAVQNAHVDVLGVLLVLAALALERRGRTLPAVVVLTLAALVKVYPGLLLPLLVRRRPLREVAAAAGVSAAVAVLAYLPHVLAVGVDVVGYLPGYLAEERYGSGTRYLLLGALGLRGAAASAVVGLGLAALLAWTLRTRRPAADAGARLFAGVLLLVTPVQPWYGLLLVALVALSGWWAGLAVAAAAYPLFFATILDGPGAAAGRASYGVAAVVVAGALLRERVSRRPAEAAAGPPAPRPAPP